MQECASESGSAIHILLITGENVIKSACEWNQKRLKKSIVSDFEYLCLHLLLDCDVLCEMRKYYVTKIFIRIEEYPNLSVRLESYPNLSVNQIQKW